MNDKVQPLHNLDYAVADLEETKRDNVQQNQYVVIKERQNNKKSDAKQETTLLNMREIQSKSLILRTRIRRLEKIYCDWRKLIFGTKKAMVFQIMFDTKISQKMIAVGGTMTSKS